MLLLSAKGLIHLKLRGSSKCQEIIWTSGGEIYQKTICFGMTGHWMQACSRGKEISCKGTRDDTSLDRDGNSQMDRGCGREGINCFFQVSRQYWQSNVKL